MYGHVPGFSRFAAVPIKKNISMLFTYKTTSTKIDQQKLFITTTTTTISRDGDRKKGQVFFNRCEIKGDRLHRRSLTN